MPKYQKRNHFTPDWEDCDPIPELAALLDALPGNIVTLQVADLSLHRPIDWRVKPRDVELYHSIREAVGGHHGLADKVYDLLEERDLV